MIKKSYPISLIIILSALIFLFRLKIGTDVIVVDKRFDEFPRQIGVYYSFDISMESNVIKELDTDDYLFRKYISPKGDSVSLYIGYYGTKKGGRSDHNPEGCYPGAGWAIEGEEKVELTVKNSDSIHRVVLNRMDVSKAGANEIVYYWYQTNRDKVISSGIQLNINRFLSRLIYHRNDGAFIRVSAEMNGNPEQTKKTIEQFIYDIYPLIVDFWPLEKDA